MAACFAVPFDAKGEALDKVQVTEGLQEHIGDAGVLAFLLSILGVPHEYQAARLHLFK